MYWYQFSTTYLHLKYQFKWLRPTSIWLWCYLKYRFTFNDLCFECQYTCVRGIENRKLRLSQIIFFYYSFNAVFQLLNTTQTTVWPALSMAIGNNTIWLANAAANVVSISYNTSVRKPSFISFHWFQSFRTLLVRVLHCHTLITAQQISQSLIWDTHAWSIMIYIHNPMEFTHQWHWE